MGGPLVTAVLSSTDGAITALCSLAMFEWNREFCMVFKRDRDFLQCPETLGQGGLYQRRRFYIKIPRPMYIPGTLYEGNCLGNLIGGTERATGNSCTACAMPDWMQ